MANQQVREMLDEARSFHRRLSEAYRQSADRSNRERLRMLLFYLSRHESHLEEALKGFAAEGRKTVLDAWIPVKTIEHVLVELRGLSVAAGETPDDLVRKALQYDDRLVAFFRLLAEKSRDEAVRQLFLSLVKMEERAEATMARDTVDFSDL